MTSFLKILLYICHSVSVKTVLNDRWFSLFLNLSLDIRF
ncbi:Uncharacterized protein ChrSV_5013 [Chromobacterium vaccinii]|nr:Uncharacterized protein ChrSW_5007 [Chromobacterium vaccinii]QND92468.1 Uncharacterized protein ChrSV_5013 [Chromobacterium vaccinii]